MSVYVDDNVAVNGGGACRRSITRRLPLSVRPVNCIHHCPVSQHCHHVMTAVAESLPVSAAAAC